MNPTDEQLADAEMEMLDARNKVADLGALLADLCSHRLSQHNARLQTVPLPRATCEGLIAAVGHWRNASADYALLFLASQGVRVPPGLRVFSAAEDRDALVAAGLAVPDACLPHTPDEAPAPEGGAA